MVNREASKMRRNFIRIVGLFCLGIIFSNCGPPEAGPGSDQALHTGAALGFSDWLAKQDRPDAIPRLFAPNQLSTGSGERCVAFSPDMMELYHQQYVDPELSSIVFRGIEGGSWTQARVASFSGVKGGHDCGPAFTDGGETLIFYSNRPIPADGTDQRDYNFWSTTRSKNGWTPARVLGAEINSHFDDEDVSFTSGGVAYFSSNRSGNYDIYRTRLGHGSGREPERLGASVNSPFFDGHPCIAPDESFLVFFSGGRPDEVGEGDLYVSFRDDSDKWSPAKILDGLVNTTAHEAAPTLSPDGEYLFFLSQRDRDGGVYWVSMDYIESFRPSQPSH
jgi:Tol biopolymer transport system component